MERAVRQQGTLTLGPVLFNWQPERWRDFYFRIADEAAVTDVYVGEVVCAKRAPLFEPYYRDVVDRLSAAGKTVVRSTLAQVATRADRNLVQQVCAAEGVIEANDGSAFLYLQGRPHHIGPFMNVYNEYTVAFLARSGAQNICLPTELPATAIAALCSSIRDPGVTVEVQAFGRQSLALSARCYHARVHERTKDSCRFVCGNDPDGMELSTLDGRPFLAVNGVQTMSYEYLNLIHEAPELHAMGVSRFRLLPHGVDMVAIASIFRAVLDEQVSTQEAAAQLDSVAARAYCNGFYRGKPGYGWSTTRH